MERNFYPENFEKFLRGHSDHFKMSPSKKVWHGIYNDIHPGRRWPSIAISMVFIFTLVIIGHLNTNNGHNTFYGLSSLQATHADRDTKTLKALKQFNAKHLIEERSVTVDKPIKTNNPSRNFAQLSLPNKEVVAYSGTEAFITNINDRKTNNNILDKKDLSTEVIENNLNIIPSENKITKSYSKSTAVNNESTSEMPAPQLNKETTNAGKESTVITTLQSSPNIIKTRKINNVAWTYYISPSLSYRYLSDENINNSVIQRPRLGYESGMAMSFGMFKKIQFTTGLQINYSGYNIKATNIHPTITTLTLTSDYPGQYKTYSTVSHYGNSTGPELTTLKNYSLQASLPIGLQYMFGGNDNIKFGASANFQPTFIIASRSYLLSSDKRNYMTNPDIMRNWNMNTSFTTYASITTNSLNWQIGPQVRYQLLSTYSSRYPVKEHLLNYGIRVGISKSSK